MLEHKTQYFINWLIIDYDHWSTTEPSNPIVWTENEGQLDRLPWVRAPEMSAKWYLLHELMIQPCRDPIFLGPSQAKLTYDEGKRA